MIELQNTILSYGSTPVLSGISHIFKQSEFTCVIGKNGCGKSTLLRAAAGMSPYDGHILLDGVEIRSVPRQECAKRLSYLPQLHQAATMDVGTLIGHGRYPHLGFSKTLSAKDREKVAYAASVTGVESLLGRDLAALSGGERQRAYIAMMIAQDTDIMLLDEPTTHLDVEHQLELMELLKKLHQTGKGIIMALHDLPQAFSYAGRVLLLSGGRVAAEGAPDELCTLPVLGAALGVTVKKTAGPDDLYSYKMAKGV